MHPATQPIPISHELIKLDSRQGRQLRFNRSVGCPHRAKEPANGGSAVCINHSKADRNRLLDSLWAGLVDLRTFSDQHLSGSPDNRLNLRSRRPDTVIHMEADSKRA